MSGTSSTTRTRQHWVAEVTAGDDIRNAAQAYVTSGVVRKALTGLNSFPGELHARVHQTLPAGEAGRVGLRLAGYARHAEGARAGRRRHAPPPGPTLHE